MEQHPTTDDTLATTPAPEIPTAETTPEPVAEQLLLSTEPATAEAPADAPKAEKQRTEKPAIQPVPEVDPANGPTLAELAAKATKQRLSNDEEDRAAGLIRLALLDPATVLEDLVAEMLKLAWMVCVRGVGAAWPALDTEARDKTLAALAASGNEQSRRIRLSVARALTRLDDAPNALRTIAAVVRESLHKETAELESRDAQNLANVLLGKGRPWLLTLDFSSLDPTDLDTLVPTMVVATVLTNQAPVTLVSILQWAAAHERLATLPEYVKTALGKALGKLSFKWQDAVRNEVPTLPEDLRAQLTKTPEAPKPEPAKRERGGRRNRNERTSDDTPAETDSEPSEETPEATDAEPASEDAETDDEDDSTDLDEDGQPKPKERPVYVSKTVPPKDSRDSRGGKTDKTAFDFRASMRQLEQYVNGLRNELSATQSKLNKALAEPRKPKKEPAPEIEGASTPEELARLNLQFEARILELDARIAELTADAEIRAISRGVTDGTQPPDPVTELKQVLALKMQEAFDDFRALELEDPDIVVQQHYRTLMREVFAVLNSEGIPFRENQEPPKTHDSGAQQVTA